jgi:hypothetical protein
VAQPGHRTEPSFMGIAQVLQRSLSHRVQLCVAGTSGC